MIENEDKISLPQAVRIEIITCKGNCIASRLTYSPTDKYLKENMQAATIALTEMLNDIEKRFYSDTDAEK